MALIKASVLRTAEVLSGIAERSGTKASEVLYLRACKHGLTIRHISAWGASCSSRLNINH